MAGPYNSFRSGKGGRATYGSSNLRGKVWSVKESGVRLDTTNFESFTTAYGSTGVGGGRSFTQMLTGPENADAKYSGAWDAGLNSFDDPPGIYIREDGPAVALYTNRVDNVFYNFLATAVKESNLKVDQNGLVTFDFDFENQGPYIRPTGSFV